MFFVHLYDIRQDWQVVELPHNIRSTASCYGSTTFIWHNIQQFAGSFAVCRSLPASWLELILPFEHRLLLLHTAVSRAHTPSCEHIIHSFPHFLFSLSSEFSKIATAVRWLCFVVMTPPSIWMPLSLLLLLGAKRAYGVVADGTSDGENKKKSVLYTNQNNI